MGGGTSIPKSGDSVYTKLFCLTTSIDECLGMMVVGLEYQCFCIRGHDYIGVTDCPVADVNCSMSKPKGDCFGSLKVLFCKVGIECPDKPYLVCCTKEL